MLLNVACWVANIINNKILIELVLVLINNKILIELVLVLINYKILIELVLVLINYKILIELVLVLINYKILIELELVRGGNVFTDTLSSFIQNFNNPIIVNFMPLITITSLHLLKT